MARAKPHLNLIFVGHVDHGKSTTVGRLFYDSGIIDEQTMRKLKEKAVEVGKVGFEFAFVMDTLKEERQRGVTIDLNYKKFITDKREVTIIDAPGHRDFVKNMITGTSQADAAVLVVSAVDGVQAQTQEHALLTKTLGVGQLCVAVNKMDAAGFKEDKYTKTKEDVSALLKKVGYKVDQINFIPIAALKGDNVFKKSENMPWYKGPTLRDQLDLFKDPEKPTNLPLRLPIQDVYNITGVGVVPVGKIETGIMKVGDKIIVVPGREGKGITGEVKTIEMHHEQAQQAEPGDNIGFNVRGLTKKDIARGDVLGHENNVPNVLSKDKEFTAQIIVINHPTVLTAGYTPVFHIHTAQVACQITKIEKKIDPATAQVIQENPDFLKNGEAAIIRCKPTKPLVIEKQKEIPQMARFAIRDAGRTVAVGICLDYQK
ncbi:translation elongation factor EF-1 subunit alpha [Candidatus Woesearchaeota archaeon]|nr:translation elongation factor EF-1 subunit alpha [Candidatus Woesearchaeota archaeon]